MKNNIPTGWRLLTIGEVIRKGDKHISKISSDTSEFSNLTSWYSVDNSIGHKYSYKNTYTLDADIADIADISWVIRKIENNTISIEECIENLKNAYKSNGYSNISINIKATITKTEEFNHFIL